MIGQIIGYTLLGLFLALFAFMLIRTILNRPKQEIRKTVDKIDDIDKERCTRHLQEAIRIKTISMVDEYTDNSAPFIEFREWLEKSYPLTAKTAERTIIQNYSLVYHIKGSDPSLKPGCFLSHIDVVPATAEGWEHDPFAGVLTDDGFIYGRGSQDMKHHLVATIEAIEYHLEHGTKFERDIYLCFGHDEEPPQSCLGASSICEYFQNQGIELEFVIDEGGATLDGNMLGVPHLIALIGATEKGNGDFEISVEKSGGHASNPNPPTAVGVLSDCIKRIEDTPMKPRWSPLSKQMIDSLAPFAIAPIKFIFTNRDIFSPLLKLIFTKATPMTNALLRTTFAPTMLWGSDARNVIPRKVKASVNFRTITGETAQDVKAHAENVCKKYVKKGQVKIDLLGYSDPTPDSDTKADVYGKIEKSILETFENSIVAPYPFIAASDARFYVPVCKNIFRFGPFIFGLDDQTRIHALNERLHVDQLVRGTEFFIKCIKNTCCK